jgi:secreted Zn-dependent insulinase-like peptidase
MPKIQRVNIQDKFIEFREGYYLTNQMKLVIFRQEPLDVLEV